MSDPKEPGPCLRLPHGIACDDLAKAISERDHARLQLVKCRPTDEQIDRVICDFARSRARGINLTYDYGPYEITKATSAAINLAKDILALAFTDDQREPSHSSKDE